MQDIIVAFYELAEEGRPKNEDEFVIWAYRLGSQYLQQRRYGSHKEMPLPTFRYKDSDDEIEAEFQSSEVGWHHQRPTQFLYLLAMDLLRSVARLPEDMQRTVYRLIDSGDVTEYAKDHGVNLFEAMKELKHSRDVMRRILEDDADEKKSANSIDN